MSLRATPQQFETMFFRNATAPDGPEKRLVCAVLRQAIDDAQHVPEALAKFNAAIPEENELAREHNRMVIQLRTSWLEIISADTAAVQSSIDLRNKMRKENGHRQIPNLPRISKAELKALFPEIPEKRLQKLEDAEPVRYFLEGTAGDFAAVIGLDAEFVKEMFMKHSGLFEQQELVEQM